MKALDATSDFLKRLRGAWIFPSVVDHERLLQCSQVARYLIGCESLLLGFCAALLNTFATYA
ncbi:hypothetical protein WK23_04360 [Burkholderia vietnamiensis]|nr:hypothetical protein WK23_04360 [Burkholderia vietnamiensis]